MIHVIATVQLAPGTREPFLEEFRKVVPLVRAEDGCLEYGAAIDEPTTLRAQELVGYDTVIVVEKWENVAALEGHLTAPHMTDYRGRVSNYVRGVQLQVLRPV